jgi:hypothetical protein
MDQLDLDIRNYSIKDLENFFRIRSNSKYNADDVELKEAQIRETLLQSGHVNKRMKRDLIKFLESAKQLLIDTNCRPKAVPRKQQSYSVADVDSAPIPQVQSVRAENVLQRQPTNYIQSMPGEFFPGTLNQLNTRVITKCLNIDTRFRNDVHNTKSSDFTIQLPIKMNKVVSMQLSAIELPITFYGISETYGNNQFFIELHYKFNVTQDEAIKEHRKMIVVPDGNYTANDLIQLLNLLLVSNFKDDEQELKDVFSYIKFSIDINENGSGSRRVSIGPTDNNDVTFSNIKMDFETNKSGIIDNANLYTRFGWNLGYVKNKYEGSDFHTAENIIEPTTKYVFLAVDDFNNNSNNHFVSAFNQSFLNTDILARISLKGTNINTVNDNEYTLVAEPRVYFGPVDIQRLRVRLFDEHGRLLHMNNSNFSFCITLKMLYDL